MKVAGFTIARNVLKYDYPIKEAITSVLPLCDEFVIAVGKSDDDTLAFLKSIDDKRIRIVETVWDDTLREGGRVLAVETNKAYQAISSDVDWAFYIQADEVLHESYIPEIRKQMEANLHNQQIEGLLFKYKHFFGSYDYVAASTNWYRREIRIVRHLPTVYSYRDAQGFRIDENRKLNVKLIDAYIYHYGWVRPPAVMSSKSEAFSQLYNKSKNETSVASAKDFDYSAIDVLDLFDGTHPEVMKERIASKNWKFDHDLSKKNISPKERFKEWFEALFGHRLWEYKNYKIISK